MSKKSRMMRVDKKFEDKVRKISFDSGVPMTRITEKLAKQITNTEPYKVKLIGFKVPKKKN